MTGTNCFRPDADLYADLVLLRAPSPGSQDHEPCHYTSDAVLSKAGKGKRSSLIGQHNWQHNSADGQQLEAEIWLSLAKLQGGVSPST